MRLSALLIVGAVFALAGLGAFFGALVAANAIQQRSEIAVSESLDVAGLDWAYVRATGLQVELSGTAPDEATRFRALATAGTIVDAARVIDSMEVALSAPTIDPEFSIELLRNDAGISLIGLIPTQSDREFLLERVAGIADGAPVIDLLEAADYDTPPGWDEAVEFGLSAVDTLGRSKISIAADKMTIVAAAESKSEQARLESLLARRKPSGVVLSLQISAPRPVISPYTVRFLIENGSARFDACAANDVQMRRQIAVAATNAGFKDKFECPLGLGMPSPSWGTVTATAIDALADLGEGSVTLADTGITLVASAETPRSEFDRVVGRLENALPTIFKLHAVLPDPVQVDGTGEGDGPPEFVATRSPEGLVQLRGKLPDDLVKSSAESYALARFGMGNVIMGTRNDDNLPKGWAIRVLAGLAALAELENGSVVVQENFIEVRGNTGNAQARAEVSRLLSEKLGNAENFSLQIKYIEALDPVASLPTPEECVAEVQTILAERKITFEPGSTNIDGSGKNTIEKIGDVLKTCPDTKIEIGGHTDSQGSDELNARISRERAQAVKVALENERVNTLRMLVEGYGETQPIADNATEEGREANRRIVFTLIAPAPIEETTTALEALEDAVTADPTASETTNEQN
ncbi:OmpA family protein [Algirhabdus cladophorae]|uniref:OmpA family protein n=1 Tax=Algirhabdus cladophorae TaxID=3377108 RepID=UPI003B84ADED